MNNKNWMIIQMVIYTALGIFCILALPSPVLGVSFLTIGSVYNVGAMIIKAIEGR